MIALVLLILVVIVVGGGIEVVRRMRFGGGAAAAHHRALDTLGQLTNQGADRRVDLAPPAGTPLLDHVRRVVESDPTHPRISPRPISRPVAIPAAVNGSESPAPDPEEVVARPAPTEIEGVRILLPDPPPPTDPPPDGLPLADRPLAEADEEEQVPLDDPEELGLDETVVADDDVDVEAADEDEDEADGRVAAADAGTTAVAHLDDPLIEAAGGHEDDVHYVPWDDDVIAGSDHDEPAEDADPVPVGAISLADHHPEEVRSGDAAPSGTGAIGGDLVGTPVSPPTATDGAESVRVLRSDEAVPDQAVHVPEQAARTPVAATVPAGGSGSPAFARAVSGPPPGPGDVEGFRILPPSEAAPAIDGSDLVTDQVAAIPQAPAPEHRPWRHPGESPVATGAFHPAPPEQTRAQLAALARSGRVEPIGGGGGGGAHRSHNRRSRRTAGHTRSTHRPARHRGLRVATATLAVLVAAVGVVSAVVITNKGSSNRPTHTAAPVTTAPAPTTTTPAVPASLISRTSSTAVYRVTGSPIISLVGSGSCWIEIRQGDQTGKILFEGVLSSGAQKTQTGPFWVRLGNPAAISVQVNGATLNQPAGTTGNPYNLQFQ